MRALRLIVGTRYSVLRSAGVLVALGGAGRAHAASEPKERAISADEVVSWLDTNGEQPTITGSGTDELAPPPPPRHKGFVVESGIGAFGQLGELKNISPIAPWFHLQFGYEPFKFLLVFAEADLMLSNTSYAHQPPPTRTYSLWGAGAGLRGTVKVSERVGLYLQSSLGGAELSSDVLYSYGYRHADEFNLYLASELGVEWYQVSPHLALTLHGGVRDYTATFKRDSSSQPPLAWVSAIGIRYTF